jgi:ABC-2 type transport system permease protein
MSASIVLWQKQIRKSLVHTEEIFGTLFQPILWVVLFGVGMRSLIEAMSPAQGADYITFVLPGIIALTVVGGAIGGGSAWLTERMTGIVKEYLVAPIPRLSILMGSALSITSKVLIQCIIILIVGVLMGAKLSPNPLGWIGGFLLIAGYAVGFSGIALAVATKLNSSEGYHVMIFMLQLPLLFMSNSLYPLATMPTWMRIGSMLNPTTYIVTGLRNITLAPVAEAVGVSPIATWVCFVVIAAFAVIGMALALRTFQSTIE